jgi:hypothetical protein
VPTNPDSAPVTYLPCTGSKQRELIKFTITKRAGLASCFGENTLKISASLNQKIAQAVQTSMQIEGCKPVQSDAVKRQAQALMEQHRVQVSVRRK